MVEVVPVAQSRARSAYRSQPTDALLARILELLKLMRHTSAVGFRLQPSETYVDVGFVARLTGHSEGCLSCTAPQSLMRSTSSKSSLITSWE
jgi:hypothetical protein